MRPVRRPEFQGQLNQPAAPLYAAGEHPSDLAERVEHPNAPEAKRVNFSEVSVILFWYLLDF